MLLLGMFIAYIPGVQGFRGFLAYVAALILGVEVEHLDEISLKFRDRCSFTSINLLFCTGRKCKGKFEQALLEITGSW